MIPKDKSLVVGGGALWNTSHPQATYELAFDPVDPPAGWRLVEYNESYCRYEFDAGDWTIQKTEYREATRLLEENRRMFNDSSGRRWGDGDVIGSVPMPEYFRSGLAEANKQGDREFQRKWWNNPDNRKWRKREGSL